MGKDKFLEAVDTAKEYIRAGDIFQVKGLGFLGFRCLGFRV